MVPAITLHTPRAGHPVAGHGRPGPAHRVSRRELRGDRLRLRRPERLDRGRGPAPAVSPAGSGSPIRSRRSSTGSPRSPSPPSRPVDVPTALRLGPRMIALQASIGIAQRPGRRPPGRRTQARRSRSRPAWWRAVGRAPASWSPPASALALAAPSGPAVAGLGAAILAIGYAYDLRVKGTRLVVGCPSRSGSRCCRSSPGSAPRGRSRAFMGRLVLAGRARRRGARDRRTPERTWSGTGPRASPRWRPRWARSGRGGSGSASAWRSSRSPWGRCWMRAAAGSPPTVALIGVVAGAALLLVGATVGYRAGPDVANVPGSSRPSAIAVLAVGWLGVVTAQP